MHKKFNNLLSSIYKQYNPGSKYIVILTITMPTSKLKDQYYEYYENYLNQYFTLFLFLFIADYDINVTPDKREIIFRDPEQVFASLK